MKKYASARALSAVLLSAFAALGLIATAPAANAYSNINLHLGLSQQTVISGHLFTASLSADSQCTLALSFLDQNAQTQGTTLTHTFTAPVVSKKTVYQVSGTCTTSAVAGGAGLTLKPSDTVVGPVTADITVLPEGASAAIPNAGGPSIWWLVAGLAAVLAGIVSLVGSRMRRDDDAGVLAA